MEADLNILKLYKAKTKISKLKPLDTDVRPDLVKAEGDHPEWDHSNQLKIKNPAFK